MYERCMTQHMFNKFATGFICVHAYSYAFMYASRLSCMLMYVLRIPHMFIYAHIRSYVFMHLSVCYSMCYGHALPYYISYMRVRCLTCSYCFLRLSTFANLPLRSNCNTREFNRREHYMFLVITRNPEGVSGPY